MTELRILMETHRQWFKKATFYNSIIRSYDQYNDLEEIWKTQSFCINRVLELKSEIERIQCIDHKAPISGADVWKPLSFTRNSGFNCLPKEPLLEVCDKDDFLSCDLLYWDEVIYQGLPNHVLDENPSIKIFLDYI